MLRFRAGRKTAPSSGTTDAAGLANVEFGPRRTQKARRGRKEPAVTVAVEHGVE
jgi:hypothetical protein